MNKFDLGAQVCLSDVRYKVWCDYETRLDLDTYFLALDSLRPLYNQIIELRGWFREAFESEAGE